MNWRTILFGTSPGDSQASASNEPADEAVPATPSGGNGGEEDIYAQVPEAELRASQQHRWLFDDGIVHWNRHRQTTKFAPKFHGMNFVKEAAKTRLWGRPADIVGEDRVVLTGVDWALADLQGTTLSRADLRNARLMGADLRNANLAGALLNGANLADADLRGANLDGAQFARANLARANLAGASMKGANFAWANMVHTIVGAKNLAEANLFGAIREERVVEVRRRAKEAPEDHASITLP